MVSTDQMSFIHLVTQTNSFARMYVLCNERCVFFLIKVNIIKLFFDESEIEKYDRLFH